MKKILIAVGALVVLLVGALLVAPSFIDWNAYKPEIARAVKDATGRDLAIEGDIGLSLLPTPRVAVDELRLANAPGAAAPEMVRLERATVHLAWAPLLGGTIEVSSITLVEPVIELEVLPDGRGNWELGQPAGPGGTGPAAGGGGGTADVRIDSLAIERGVVVLRDGEVVRRVEGIDAEIALQSLAGPFTAEAKARLQGAELRLTASTGEMRDGRPVPASLTIGLPDAKLEARFAGALTLGETPSLRGDVSASAPDAALLAATLARVTGAAVPPLPPSALELAGKVEASAAAAALNDLVAQLGDSKATGALSVGLGTPRSFDLTLALNRLDLDAILASAPAATARAAATAPGRTAPPATPAPAPAPGTGAEPALDFAIPRDLQGSLDVTVEAISYRGQLVRQFRLTTGVRDGEARINQLSAQLPGGSDISVLGGVAAAGGQPRFEGSVDAVSDNLRAVLDWLGAPLAEVPADRLRRASVKAAISATPARVEVRNARMSVDTTQVNGGLALDLKARPAFGLSLAIDQVNLDAYLPERRAQPQAGTAAAATPLPAATPAAPLAVLGTFDANIKAQLGSLTLNRTPVRDVRLDLQVQNGSLRINEATIADLAGGRLAAKGLLKDAATRPEADLTLTVAAEQPARLLRLAAIDAPSRLGKLAIDAALKGNLERAEVSGKLGLGQLAVDLAGWVAPLAGPPRFDLRANARHPDLAALLRALEIAGSDQPRSLGPMTLELTAASQQPGVAVGARLEALGGPLTIKGSLDPWTTPAPIDLVVDASHPEASRLLAAVAPDYKPAAGGTLGAFALKATVEGTAAAVEVTGLQASVGDSRLAGSASLKTSGPRPLLAVNLTSPRLLLDPWLPAEQTDKSAAPPVAPVPQKRGEWSRERIDMSALQALDAEVGLAAEEVLYRRYRVTKAEVKGRLKGGVLDLERFAGGLFGGSVSASGQLAAPPDAVPSLRLALAVKDADVRRAGQVSGATDRVSGKLSEEMQIQSRGASEFELVSALSGNGNLVVRDGAVEGFDLPAVSAQLGQLDSGVDFLVLAQRAFSGGSTPFRSLTGTYVIEQGVLRSTDIALDAPAGAGQAVATIDLPRQQIDATAEFRLTEHPKAPPFGVRLTGPLDNPRQIYDVKALQQFVAERVVERGVRRLLDQGSQGGAQQPAPAPDAAPREPVTPQAPTKPEDVLKGILRGLGKPPSQ